MGNETFSVRHRHGIYGRFGRRLSRGEGGVRTPPLPLHLPPRSALVVIKTQG